jgi:hypothetical protein
MADAAKTLVLDALEVIAALLMAGVVLLVTIATLVVSPYMDYAVVLLNHLPLPSLLNQHGKPHLTQTKKQWQ